MATAPTVCFEPQTGTERSNQSCFSPAFTASDTKNTFKMLSFSQRTQQNISLGVSLQDYFLQVLLSLARS